METRVEDLLQAMADVLRAEHYNRLANEAEAAIREAVDERDLEARGITAVSARLVVPNVAAARRRFAETCARYVAEDGHIGPRAE